MPTNNQPVSSVKWVARDSLRANGYNPNHVPPIELDLLAVSILSSGWTQPIVARSDGEIVDGFHRWTVALRPEIAALTGGLIPVVTLDQPMDEQIMATIRHNRARGIHGIMPMAQIVNVLKNEHGLSDAELITRLGMEQEEIDRLYDQRGMPTKITDQTEGEFNRAWHPAPKGAESGAVRKRKGRGKDA